MVFYASVSPGAILGTIALCLSPILPGARVYRLQVALYGALVAGNSFYALLS